MSATSCVQCGVAIAPRNRRGGAKWYCTERCRRRAREDRRNATARAATAARAQLPQACAWCDGEFYGRRRQYCSAACRTAAGVSRRPQPERVDLPARVCVVCDATYAPRTALGQTCGPRCRAAVLSATRPSRPPLRDAYAALYMLERALERLPAISDGPLASLRAQLEERAAGPTPHERSTHA